MAETFCGKSCAECTYKEELNCPGCKAGPGARSSYGSTSDTECELAKCCQNKGHKECSGCNFNSHCGILQSNVRMPQYRLEKRAANAAWEKEVAERAKQVYKWLWVMFWLIVPGTVASLLSNDTIATLLPSLKVPGLILSIVCNIVCAVSLLYLSAQEDRYKTAGICVLVCAAWSIVLIATNGNEIVQSWTAVLSIPFGIVGFVGSYNEMTAHSIILTGVDAELSEKWSKLWKWYIGSYCAILCSTLLVVIAGVLGLLVLVAAAIVFVVVDILKFVYLYQTARAFEAHLPQ